MSVTTLEPRCAVALAPDMPTPPAKAAVVSSVLSQTTDGRWSAIGKKRVTRDAPNPVVCQSPQLLTIRLFTRSQRSEYSLPSGMPPPAIGPVHATGGSPRT